MINPTLLTPMPSVLVLTVLSLIYLGSPNILQLMNYVGFATWLSIGVSVLCVPWLRYTRPDLERPIKVNLAFPIIYILITLAIVILPAVTSPVETAIGAAMILSAVPIYFLLIWWESKPK